MAASNAQYLIQFDPDKCTQCHGCEIACKSWRNLGLGVRYRRVLNLWQGVYPRVKNTSLSLACLHCIEPACADSCPEGAISKRATDGKVVVDETLCTGCRICAEACSFGVPQFGGNGTMEKCDLCPDRPAIAAPPCVDTCPGKALSLVQVSPIEKMVHEEEIAQLLTSR